MTLLAKIALGPLLLWQARGARRHAVTLPEAGGPRNGEVGTGLLLRLLIVGDSSAAGVGAATQDEALAGPLTRTLADAAGRRVRWQLVARSGVSTPEAAELLDEHPLTPADVAVAVLGVNDVVEQIPTHRALLARAALVDRLTARAGVRHVVFAPLPPMHEFPLLPHPLRAVVGCDARRLDAAQADWAARQRGVSHCPIALHLGREHMAADGFHPGPAVYRACGEALAHHITQRVLPEIDFNRRRA